MAYRRPAVTVIQEFVGLVPALATFNLPTVAVGAAYELIDDDLIGTYSGSQQAYAYSELSAGAQVDVEAIAEDEAFPATKKEIEVFIRDAEVEIVAQNNNGSANGQNFNDPSSAIFANVLAGDIIRVVEDLTEEIVAPQTDGVTTDTNQDILTAGVALQFADVEVGDVVTVTGGTNTNTGTYNVIEKIDNSNIRLDGNVNDGVGPAADVAYSISGERGEDNKGDYRIKEVVDANNLITEGVFPEVEGTLTYSIVREVAEIQLARVASLPGNGFFADEDNITLPAGLQVVIGSGTYDIVSGNVEANYRGLRNDLAANVVEYGTLADLQAQFGIDQITPANPLAFALSLMLQNTVTPVNGLGLDGNAVSNEVLSFQAAFDVLALTEMYAIVPLTQNPVIHQNLKSHVEQLSQPDQKLERVGIVNRRIVTVETAIDEAETSSVQSGARVIVNTQTNGAHDGANLDVLTDSDPDQFLDVNPGDSVVIVSGGDVTPGTYLVQEKTDNNNLVLDGDFAILGGGATNVNYFIFRRDGLGANGTTFYDRDATFISGGAAPGYYLIIKAASNNLALGRFKIASLTSENQFEIEQVPGITSLVADVTYEVERDLTKTEQAQFIAGYSEGIGSRRIVNVWPDVLETPVGSQTEDLPGYYGAAVIGALTTGLPTQQGFTNLTVSGFLGLKNSTGYFTQAQLDTVASGGTMIFAQDIEEAPLYIRHQLTTDVSAIKFQEFSVTKNVDFIAKFLRDQFKGYIGVYNIVDTTLDELKTNAKASIEFLRDDTRLPRIGGVIRSGTLALLEEDETQIDTVNMRFVLDIPIPLNNLNITIQV